jgi:hypothetical protein
MADQNPFDIVQHPVLGQLKFPVDMPSDQRNASIQYALSQRPQAAPVAAPTQTPTAPPQKGLLGKAWDFANDPSYAATLFDTAPEEGRLAQVREAAIAAGDPSKAGWAEFQRGQIDPRTGITSLLTPLTAATLMAGPLLGKAGLAGRAISAGLSSVYSYPAAKDIARTNPNESWVEAAARRGGDVGQLFMGALGLHEAMAPRVEVPSVIRSTTANPVSATQVQNPGQSTTPQGDLTPTAHGAAVQEPKGLGNTPQSPESAFQSRVASTTDSHAPQVDRRIGEGTSVVHLADTPRPVVPQQEIQSQTGEIARLQSVLTSPTALPEEKLYASKALQASLDLRDQATASANKRSVDYPPSAPFTISPEELQAYKYQLAGNQRGSIGEDDLPKLTPERTREIDEYVKQWQTQKVGNNQSAPISPEIAPEPSKDGMTQMSASQLDTVQDIMTRIGAKAATATTPEGEPYRRMVEEAGGKYVAGPDMFGLIHYDAPSSMTGGVTSVSIATHQSKMSPDMVRSEFARKAADRYTQPQISEDTQRISQQLTGQPSFELPPDIVQHMRTLAQKKIDLDNATGSSAKLNLKNQVDSITNLLSKKVGSYVDSMPAEHLDQMRDVLTKRVNDLGDTAKVIREHLRPDDGTKGAQLKDIQGMKKEGYAREISLYNPELDANVGATVDTEVRGPLSRSIYSIVEGKEPRVTMKDFVPRKDFPNLEPEELKTWLDKAIPTLQATHDELLRDVQNALQNGEEISATDIPARLRELDSDARALGSFPPYRGKDAKGPGERTGMPIRSADGSVRELQPLESMSLKNAASLMGVKRVAKMPSRNEFSDKAKEYEQHSQMQQGVIDAINNKIGLKPVTTPYDKEGGFVGEAAVADEKRFAVDNVAKLAKQKGYKVDRTDGKKEYSASYDGWLAPDGNTIIKNGQVQHYVVAQDLFPDIEKQGSAMKSMLEHNWIRKESNTRYQVGNLTSTNLNAIEWDLIRNGHHGQPITLDFASPHRLGYNAKSIVLDRGWENLEPAVTKLVGNGMVNPEAGKVSGTEIMGGMAAGMAAGGAVGGVPGAFVGGVLGATVPALIRTPAVARAFKWVGPLRNAMGVTANVWFHPEPTNFGSASPEMKAIRDAQIQSLKAPEAQLAWRTRLIGDVWKTLDPFAFVTDRPNAIQEFTMAQDPRGKGFRDSKGLLSLDESPYVAVRTAVTGIRSEVGLSRQQYGKIENDATKAGLHEETTQFLNLSAYKRAFEVVKEHMQAQAKDISDKTSKLNLSNDVAEQVHLKESIEEGRANLDAMREKINQGKVAPGGYTTQTIQRDLQSLEQKVGPQKFAQIKDFAKRVYDLNRQALDIAADSQNGFKNGIISKDDYKTYTSRGDEYIPMKRILESAAENNKRDFGKSSPLYIRQQNIIHQLEGSDKVNVDPWQASADGMSEAIREHARNQTLTTFIDAGKKAPEIGKYFTKVKGDYKAAKGEMTVGHYQGGEQHTYAVPDWLGHSLDVSAPHQAQGVLRVVNDFTARIFKGAATVYNPLWTLKTQIPSMLQAEVITAEGPKDWASRGRALGEAVRGAWTHDGDRWNEASKEGLMRNNLMRMLYPEARMNNIQLGKMGPLSRGVLHPIETLNALTSLPSDIIVLNHFNRLRQAGLSPTSAAYKTMHYGPLPDYAQLGRMDNAVGIATTFLKADWAHIRSRVALATNKDYRGRMAMAAAAVLIPTMAAVIHNIQQRDDKGNSDWAKVPQSVKENNFVTLTGTYGKDGNPNFIAIPKGDWVKDFVNPAEDAMYKTMDHIYKTNADTRPVTQLIANAGSRFIPGHPNFDANEFTSARNTSSEIARGIASSTWGQVTPAIRTPVEEGFNVQSKGNRVAPIVTNPKVSPEMQGYGDPSISATSMSIGKKLGLSPQRVQHITNNLIGPGMRNIESITDPLLAKSYPGGLPANQGKNIPRQDMGHSSINQTEIDATQKFYSTVQQVAKPYNDFKLIEKQNPSQAGAFFQANRDMIWKGQLATNLATAVGKINSAQKEVEASNMDPQKQEVMIRNLHELKMNALSHYQQMLEKATQRTPTGVGTGNATSQGTIR